MFPLSLCMIRHFQYTSIYTLPCPVCLGQSITPQAMWGWSMSQLHQWWSHGWGSNRDGPVSVWALRVTGHFPIPIYRWLGTTARGMVMKTWLEKWEGFQSWRTAWYHINALGFCLEGKEELVKGVQHGLWDLCFRRLFRVFKGLLWWNQRIGYIPENWKAENDCINRKWGPGVTTWGY